MSKADRERRHQANLQRINRIERVIGRGDRARVDHEGTLFDRARLLEEEISAHQATERGLAALDRLLRLANEDRGAQARTIADFIAAIRNNEALPLAMLRGVDAPAGDDMVAVLDAYRHARLVLVEHVPGGARRVARILEPWSLARA